MIWIACALFLIGMLLDVAWAKYTLAVAGKRPLPAALWGAAIYMPVGVYTPALATHPLLVIPLAIGAAIGTGLTVWRARTVSRRATLEGPTIEQGGARVDTT